MSNLYISVDIESDGKIPGFNSMLSLGAVSIVDGQIRESFSENIYPLPATFEDPDTMKFWDENATAYKALLENRHVAPEVMNRFVDWIKVQGKTPVFVGYPFGFDFLFTYWYLIRFTGASPFSFSGICLKQMGMQFLRCPYREVNKKKLYEAMEYTPSVVHSHLANEDAAEQAELFIELAKRVSPWLLM